MLSFVLKNEEIQEKNLLAYVKKSIIPAVSDTYEDLQAEQGIQIVCYKLINFLDPVKK